MRSFFRKLLGRKPAPDIEDEFAWLLPPDTVTDPAPWDEYWKAQIEHGVADFVHMFCQDGHLVDAMRANGMRTVLCVGSGISQEPRALSRVGLEVTALDLSPFAMRAAEHTEAPDELLEALAGGRAAEPGGRLEFVTGDLRDPSCCPGPFDLVIERCTLQLFPPDERPAAARAVADRLAPRGLFFSHAHNGGWRPPDPRIHVMQAWFDAEGWATWQPGTPIDRRMVSLLLSTG